MICMHHHHQHHHQYPLKKLKAAPNEETALTALPQPGATFRHWRGGCWQSLLDQNPGCTWTPRGRWSAPGRWNRSANPRTFVTVFCNLDRNHSSGLSGTLHTITHITRVSAWLTNGPSYLQGFCSDQKPSLPAGFLLMALLTCRFCALTDSPPYLQVLCSDWQPSLPAGFVLWPTDLLTCRVCALTALLTCRVLLMALLTCRFCALTSSPPYLQVLCSDQQPSLPAGFVLWPTALLTCRFCALLSNSPSYLQVLCSAVQQPFLSAGFVLCCPTALLICRFCALSWPMALLTCRFCHLLSKGPSYLQVLCSELTNGPPHLQVLCSAVQRLFLHAGFLLWPTALLTCRFSALRWPPT